MNGAMRLKVLGLLKQGNPLEPLYVYSGSKSGDVALKINIGHPHGQLRYSSNELVWIPCVS
jgi:hypothetical protein